MSGSYQKFSITIKKPLPKIMAFFEAFSEVGSAATILGKSAKIISNTNDIFMKTYKACAIHFCARLILRQIYFAID